MRTHQPRPPRPQGSFAPRQRRWTQNNNNGGRPQQQQGSQNAQRNYERYLALAQAEAQAGNLIGAENYYQHAEHYYRSMSPDPTTT
jgi:predicted S18 family serine protease